SATAASTGSGISTSTRNIPASWRASASTDGESLRPLLRRYPAPQRAMQGNFRRGALAGDIRSLRRKRLQQGIERRAVFFRRRVVVVAASVADELLLRTSSRREQLFAMRKGNDAIGVA